jgi:hypothetical protein
MDSPNGITPASSAGGYARRKSCILLEYLHTPDTIESALSEGDEDSDSGDFDATRGLQKAASAYKEGSGLPPSEASELFSLLRRHLGAAEKLEKTARLHTGVGRWVDMVRGTLRGMEGAGNYVLKTFKPEKRGDFMKEVAALQTIAQDKELAALAHPYGMLRCYERAAGGFGKEGATEGLILMPHVPWPKLGEAAKTWDAGMAAISHTSILVTLTALHKLGAAHGDVKPDNILVSPTGRSVLIDYGCASEGKTGRLTGTPGYVQNKEDLESVEGVQVDRYAADLYALVRTYEENWPEGSQPPSPSGGGARGGAGFRARLSSSVQSAGSLTASDLASVAALMSKSSSTRPPTPP